MTIPSCASCFSAADLSSSVNVLVSATIRSARGSAASCRTTSNNAEADGSEGIRISALDPTSPTDLAALPPPATNASAALGRTSYPITENPALMRFLLIADPMIPRPIIPTGMSLCFGTRTIHSDTSSGFVVAGPERGQFGAVLSAPSLRAGLIVDCKRALSQRQRKAARLCFRDHGPQILANGIAIECR